MKPRDVSNVLFIRYDKLSAGYRKMLTRRKRWAKEIGPAKYAQEVGSVYDLIDRLTHMSSEAMGIPEL